MPCSNPASRLPLDSLKHNFVDKRQVITGSSFGLSLSGVLRFTGTALSTASRTIRR
jgi:hypothetical protein